MAVEYPGITGYEKTIHPDHQIRMKHFLFRVALASGTTRAIRERPRDLFSLLPALVSSAP
jgi:hypothetical protein